MANLPDAVKALAERTPVEDVLLAVFGDKLPDVPVQTLIKDRGQVFPFILLRRDVLLGDDTGDDRFIDRAPVTIHCFVQDPNGDQDASILSEAVRVVMRDAGREKKVYPGLGHIINVTLQSSPRRVSDWATSSGPVQFADLPQGVWRYETRYTVAVRKPSTSPYQTP